MTKRLEEHKSEIDKQHKAVLETVIALTSMAVDKAMAWALPIMATAGGFWLWNKTLPEPNMFQLVGLGLYGALVQMPILFFKRK